MSVNKLKKSRLGDMLVEQGYITAEQLHTALQQQAEQGGKIGDILISLGFTTEKNMIAALSQQLELPYTDLKQSPVKPDIIRKLPERIARRFRAILLDIVGDDYIVGMTDPTDLLAYDEIKRILGGNLKVTVVAETDLLRVFDLVYRRTEDIASFAEELKEELELAEDKAAKETEEISAEAAPVVKLLDSIFEDGVQMNASDIHIEPDEKLLRIRQRVDGILHEHIVQGREIIAALVLRIKLIANLNISEKRLPQDGRFPIIVKGHNLDVRVSTMPVHYGESVVMRLLDQTGGTLKMSQLGMPKDIMDRVDYLIRKPNGLFLVTGPTGSGKTTTLYAALSELNSEEDNIITIEDPVEYTLPRINQVQVNQAIGLTFATFLRSAMRQDPDIIMVGEMRDEETVRTGLRAAMTGHLVLSTLHTNDAISSAIRLVDMGAEGYLLAGSLRGILAQRLVRKICEVCIEPYTLTDQEKVWTKPYLEKIKGPVTFKHGKGCSRCNKTGYRGRTGVYELLEMNAELGDALRLKDTLLFTHLALKQPRYKPLTETAFDYAVQGVTTLSEVFRLAGEAL